MAIIIILIFIFSKNLDNMCKYQHYIVMNYFILNQY